MIDSFRVDDGAAKATSLLRGDKLVRREERGRSGTRKCGMRDATGTEWNDGTRR
jgi:hypothetical protein